MQFIEILSSSFNFFCLFTGSLILMKFLGKFNRPQKIMIRFWAPALLGRCIVAKFSIDDSAMGDFAAKQPNLAR